MYQPCYTNMICIVFCKTVTYGTRTASEQFVLYRQIQNTFSNSPVWYFARQSWYAACSFLRGTVDCIYVFYRIDLSHMH